MARIDLRNVPLEKTLGQNLIREIEKGVTEKINLMEVCGTHTVSIFKAGLQKVLPAQLGLLSGPGCPVCVTETVDIDQAVKFARLREVLLLTFGDMMFVPGSKESLAEAKAGGAKVEIIYSPWEALEKAQAYPQKKIILLAIGFETTAPSMAIILLEAKKRGLKNFFIFSLLKLIPPAIESLLINKTSVGNRLRKRKNNISGFILPGHVSTIIGSKPYQRIAEHYRIPGVITGFEPLDILEGILRILKQRKSGISRIEIQYQRWVRPEGNVVAQKKIWQVFKKSTVGWRGLGEIAGSGLKLKNEFSDFDAEKIFPRNRAQVRMNPDCLCGEVLRGVIFPPECPQFRKNCSPKNPLGPCMVSREGTCAAYYLYGS